MSDDNHARQCGMRHGAWTASRCSMDLWRRMQAVWRQPSPNGARGARTWRRPRVSGKDLGRESGWCCPGARTRTFNLYRMADHSPDPNAKVKANNLLVGPFQPSPNAMRSGTATQLSGVECLGGGGDARALIAAMPQRAARLIVATKAGKLVACLLVTTRLPISFHFIVRVPSFG